MSADWHKWTVPCKPSADNQQNAGHTHAISKWMSAGLQHKILIAGNQDIGSHVRYNVAIPTEGLHASKDEASVQHGLLSDSEHGKQLCMKMIT